MKMTLKDLFAMCAMRAILGNDGGRRGVEIDLKVMARQAYEAAFAMWEERLRLGKDYTFDDSAIEIADES